MRTIVSFFLAFSVVFTLLPLQSTSQQASQRIGIVDEILARVDSDRVLLQLRNRSEECLCVTARANSSGHTKTVELQPFGIATIELFSTDNAIETDVEECNE